jgi:hypothetical protein
MAISIADKEKRITIPMARPGDVFDVQEHGEGCFLLIRVPKPKVKTHLIPLLNNLLTTPKTNNSALRRGVLFGVAWDAVLGVPSILRVPEHRVISLRC